MTDLCCVCNTMILDHSKATVILPYPCFCIAHSACAVRFKSAFKRYYGFIIDTDAMHNEFAKQWGFDEIQDEKEGTLLEFIKEATPSATSTEGATCPEHDVSGKEK